MVEENAGSLDSVLDVKNKKNEEYNIDYRQQIVPTEEGRLGLVDLVRGVDAFNQGRGPL